MRITEVVFIQGGEAIEPMELLDNQGDGALLDYLKQWHYPNEQEVKTILFLDDLVGTGDKVVKQGDYIMSYNKKLGYCGLIYLHN